MPVWRRPRRALRLVAERSLQGVGSRAGWVLPQLVDVAEPLISHQNQHVTGPLVRSYRHERCVRVGAGVSATASITTARSPAPAATASARGSVEHPRRGDRSRRPRSPPLGEGGPKGGTFGLDQPPPVELPLPDVDLTAGGRLPPRPQQVGNLAAGLLREQRLGGSSAGPLDEDTGRPLRPSRRFGYLVVDRPPRRSSWPRERRPDRLTADRPGGPGEGSAHL